jgi:hypothetical protein
MNRKIAVLILIVLAAAVLRLPAMFSDFWLDEFRNGRIIACYQQFLPPGERIAFVPGNRYPTRGTAWFIRHRIGELGEVPPIFTTPTGTRTPTAPRCPTPASRECTG